jgi:hypothetical protein
VTEAEPQPKGTPGMAALAPRSPRGFGFGPPWEIALDDAMSIPGSFDIVGPGNGELGLSGYPRVPLLPAS